MDEKLENQVAVVRECLFKAADVGEPGFHAARGELIRNRADRDLLVPGAVHNREHALLRDGEPVAAEVGIALFEFGRRLGVHDLKPAGIQIFNETPYHLALSGCGPALEENNDRESCAAQRRIQGGKLLFQRGHQSLIVGFFEFRFEIHFFQHGIALTF